MAKAARRASWIKVKPEGLLVEPGGFYVDPTRVVDRAVITHGHADHARPGHGAVAATAETLAIMRVRYGETPFKSGQALRFGEKITINGVTVWLAPAGHVLGSAQAVLEYRGERVVVSGDYKRRADRTCTAFEPVPCDVFITEATFGLPVFRHPEDSNEIATLMHSRDLFPERCHVIGTYSLGKAQRLISLIRAAGYDRPLYLHGALLALCELYQAHGVFLGELLPATAGEKGQPRPDLKGEIVLAPPSAIADRWARRLPDPVICMASGWMRVKQRAKQGGVELPLVISDHADWDELLATLDDVGAPEVWVTHGREEALVHAARLKGLEAQALRLIGYEDEGLMERFAQLLDRLLYAPQRTTKLKLMGDYFTQAPDPDRGIALAALAGVLDLKSAKPALIRQLGMQRVDPELFGWSYDFVGDLAETVALIWPERNTNRAPPRLGEIPDQLAGLKAAEAGALLESWLDTLDATGRWALLKLVTGGLRVGVSARLAKTALADAFGSSVDEIEEVWHGLEPPYDALFAWLEGKAPRPDMSDRAVFRPLMLANQLDEQELEKLRLAEYAAEWKWDGIRVQLAARGGERRLYSRTGDDISAAFPDIVDFMTFEGVLDGELLVVRDGEIAPFNDLQQRLNRKRVTAKMLQQHPAHIRLYDILFDGPEDLRGFSFSERRARLEAFWDRERPERTDLSELVAFDGMAALETLRAACRGGQIEGLMLKHRDSSYQAGRPKGPWFKWKRDALTVDTVVMYAQRGHGRRSSFYSDFTFGAWRDGEAGPELVPVGKAYSGFTDEELKRLDKWVRDNTVNRFGPVREVTPALVVEVAFDSVHWSSRHKSGVAMRFPRFHRIRWDKPPEEADHLESLERLIV